MRTFSAVAAADIAHLPVTAHRPLGAPWHCCHTIATASTVPTLVVPPLHLLLSMCARRVIRILQVALAHVLGHRRPVQSHPSLGVLALPEPIESRRAPTARGGWRPRAGGGEATRTRLRIHATSRTPDDPISSPPHMPRAAGWGYSAVLDAVVLPSAPTIHSRAAALLRRKRRTVPRGPPAGAAAPEVARAPERVAAEQRAPVVDDPATPRAPLSTVGLPSCTLPLLGRGERRCVTERRNGDVVRRPCGPADVPPKVHDDVIHGHALRAECQRRAASAGGLFGQLVGAVVACPISQGNGPAIATGAVANLRLRPVRWHPYERRRNPVFAVLAVIKGREEGAPSPGERAPGRAGRQLAPLDRP